MNKKSRPLITFALVCLFVLIINTPVSLFAIGEYNGVWIGPENVTIPGYGIITETTATVIYQESENTLYFYDSMFGAIELAKYGAQWVLPSPIWTSFEGYEACITKVSITFHSSSYLTGTITVEMLEITATASLSHTKQPSQNLTNDSTISGISGGMDSVRCYNIDLPSGATNLNVQTWGGSGDCDLYLIYHRPDFDFYFSEGDYNQEEITLPSPDTGKWYIILYGYESFSGLNLSVSYTANLPVGMLNVILTPQGAIDDGAKWNVDSGQWQNSGVTVSGLSVGAHIINYKAVFGWIAPSSETVMITCGQTTQITGTYTDVDYPPSVTTNWASDITSTSALLNGAVNPNGVDTTAVFEYGADTNYGVDTSDISVGSGTSYVAVNAKISGLTPNATYHYRLVASNSDGTSYGQDRILTTTIIYVEPLGVCNDNTPCFSTIQDAINFAGTGATIKIVEGNYGEGIILDEPKQLNLEGGWDATFTTQTSDTTIESITISAGTVTTDYLVIK